MRWFLALFLLASGLAVRAEEAPIKIGGIFSLSGFAAAGGEAERIGVELAVEDLNRAGGIDGRAVALIVEDNRSDFAATASAVRKLIGVDKVDAIVGPNWAEFAEVAAPIARGAGIFMVTPSGYTENITSLSPHVVTLWPSFSVQLEPVVDWLMAQGWRQMVILAAENAYTEGTARSLSVALTGKGVAVSIERVLPTAQDFRSLLLRLQRAGNSGLVFLLLEGQNVTLLRQMRGARLKLPVLGGAGLPYDVRLLPPGLLGELVSGVPYFDFFFDLPPSILERRSELRSLPPGTKPLPGVALGYDAVMVIAEAYRRCGGKEPWRCVPRLQVEGLSGHLSFSPEGVVKRREPVTKLLRYDASGAPQLDLPANRAVRSPS